MINQENSGRELEREKEKKSFCAQFLWRKIISIRIYILCSSVTLVYQVAEHDLLVILGLVFTREKVTMRNT